MLFIIKLYILFFFCVLNVNSVNIDKSKVTSSKGVHLSIRDEIHNIATIMFVRDLDKHLGFPLSGGRVTRGCFNYLLENINRKLATWKTNLLNLVGRVCLVTYVITSIPT